MTNFSQTAAVSHLPDTIPISIANLLVKYFYNTATQDQRLQLHARICENEMNIAVFEECLETSLLPVTYDPDRVEELVLWETLNPN